MTGSCYETFVPSLIESAVPLIIGGVLPAFPFFFFFFFSSPFFPLSFFRRGVRPVARFRRAMNGISFTDNLDALPAPSIVSRRRDVI